jgi:hypothetical protein
MKWIAMLSLSCLFSALFGSYELSVVAIFKNEAPFLKEWIEYHRVVGVEHFWLYNHNSSDNYTQVLEPYIKEGIVDLYDWENDGERVRNIQPTIYQHTLEMVQGKTKWLAIIDLDEFLLPMKEADVPTTLNKYFSKASMVYVNWRNFGTSGVTLKKNHWMIPNMVKCSKKNHPRNATGKCIVRVQDADIRKLWSPHFCPVKTNKLVYYGDGTLFAKDGLPFNRENDLKTDGGHHDLYIRINHYFTRDEGFWKKTKVPRILKRGEKMDIYNAMYEFFQKNTDTKIIAFLKKHHKEFWSSYYENQ